MNNLMAELKITLDCFTIMNETIGDLMAFSNRVMLRIQGLVNVPDSEKAVSELVQAQKKTMQSLTEIMNNQRCIMTQMRTPILPGEPNRRLEYLYTSAMKLQAVANNLKALTENLNKEDSVEENLE